jgi:hypothetical protein
LGSRKERINQKHLYDKKLTPSLRNKSLAGQDPHPQPRCHMRTIIYNDGTVLWSRSNHFTGIRLLPSSEDSNNFSKNQN